MKKTKQIRIAGSVTALLFIFHIPFYWMLDWEHSLTCLNSDNHAIFLCFNVISIALLALMTFLSLFRTEEMYKTGIGIAFLIFSSLFYWFRIVAEFTLFGIQDIIGSIIIIVVCIIPSVFYTAPLLSLKKTARL